MIVYMLKCVYKGSIMFVHYTNEQNLFLKEDHNGAIIFDKINTEEVEHIITRIFLKYSVHCLYWKTII